jgi:hypothetical protein
VLKKFGYICKTLFIAVCRSDNTIILSETEADMQYALSIFEKYCHQWKMKVNLQKTKLSIVINTVIVTAGNFEP